MVAWAGYLPMVGSSRSSAELGKMQVALVHGSNDGMVPVGWAQKAKRQLLQLGVPTQLQVLQSEKSHVDPLVDNAFLQATANAMLHILS